MLDSSIGTRNDRKKWLALVVTVAAQFMVVLDIAIVNVALPSIKTDLHFAQENLQWVISAYAIMFGGALLLGGRLADIFGRRRVFVAGLAVFSISSLLCGVSWSEGSLIGFRAVQGLGGALLAPAALSIVMTTFAEGPQRNRALGIWGAASGSGAAAGVLLGGVMTSYLSWSWVFFINLPVGIAAIASAPFVLAESRGNQDHRHFDVAGATSITAGVMLLVYAMTRAVQVGWSSAETISLLAVSVALIVAFFGIELRSPAPLLPLRMFRNRSLSAANAIVMLIGGITFGEFFLLTLYMQQVLGYSAIQTGVGFAAFALSVVVFSNVAQRLVTRLGVRPVMVAGLVLAALSLIQLTQLPVHGHYFWDLFPAYVAGGTGLALVFVPAFIAGLAGVQRSDAGVASGLINQSRQVGGAIGLAAATTVAASSTPAGTSLAAVDSGLTNGFQLAFVVLLGLAVAAAAIAATMLPGQPAGGEVEPIHSDRKPIEEAA